eukprot:jgi/Hompol1/4781/HPOL_003913-RA
MSSNSGAGIGGIWARTGQQAPLAIDWTALAVFTVTLLAAVARTALMAATAFKTRTHFATIWAVSFAFLCAAMATELSLTIVPDTTRIPPITYMIISWMPPVVLALVQIELAKLLPQSIRIVSYSSLVGLQLCFAVFALVVLSLGTIVYTRTDLDAMPGTVVAYLAADALWLSVMILVGLFFNITLLNFIMTARTLACSVKLRFAGLLLVFVLFAFTSILFDIWTVRGDAIPAKFAWFASDAATYGMMLSGLLMIEEVIRAQSSSKIRQPIELRSSVASVVYVGVDMYENENESSVCSSAMEESVTLHAML